MRIHDLVIDNVRAIEHLELTELPETGVILIEGENEAGKSTILDALDAVLYTPYTSTRSTIKELQPIGRDVAPEVTLRATIGPYTFTVSKRFLRKPSCTLSMSAPRKSQLNGREADEKLGRIIGEHLDRDLVSTLFLRQGQSDPGIAAAGIPSITRALDAGGEETLAGTEDTELMGRIKSEYGRYFTEKGRKKSDVVALEKAVVEAEEELRQCNEDVARLADAVDAVERLNAELAEIDRELPEATQELQQRAAEDESARAVQAKADSARETAERAQVDYERAEADLAARAEVTRRAEVLRAEADALGEKLIAAQEAAREEGATISRLEEEHAIAQESVRHARAHEEELYKRLVRARRQRQLTQLTDVVAALDDADAEVARLLNASPEREVTNADVRAIDAAANEVAVQRRLVEATAATLEILTSSDATITVDGAPIDGTRSVPLQDGTRLRFGAVEAVYHAAGSEKDAAAALAEAQRALADALATVNCESPEQARERRDNHARIASDIRIARQRREELLGEKDAETLRSELNRLRAEVEAGADSEETPDFIDEVTAEAAHDQAKKAYDAAVEKADRAGAAIGPWAERKAARALSVAESKKEAKDGELARAVSAITASEESVPTLALEATRDQAKCAWDDALTAQRTLAAEVSTVNPELVADLHAGAKARVDNLQHRRVEGEKRIAELTSHIDVATGAAEQADRAAARLTAATNALERTTRRAEAVKLLWETMCAHRDAARARYAEPFARALNRYARVVFGPDVEFALDEHLQVTARTVGQTTVKISQLSGGAKEQLSLLTRFAIADLAGGATFTSEAGDVGGKTASVPVPVVIDDALGASDPARVALMNSLFNSVARDAQVFVLTCFPKRFDRIQPAFRASIGQLKATRGK